MNITGTSVELDELPRATLTIIAINFAVLVVHSLLPLDWHIAVFKYGKFAPQYIYQPWRLVTHMFLHGGLGHFLFNMLFLWFFGAPIEGRIGARRFVIYYFGAGLSAALLQSVIDLFIYGLNAPGMVGASGAIAGSLAMFTYRCYYAKMKFVLSSFLFVNFQLPATPLLVLWFIMEFRSGVSGTATGVAHWAHIGGFIFGLVIARVNRFGLEGRIESLRTKTNEKLAAGGGWSEAETELKKLLEAAPEDGEVNHDLARMYMMREKPETAARYYAAAAKYHMLKGNIAGAFAVKEYTERIGKPMPLSFHLKAAEMLVANAEVDEAHGIMLAGLKGAKLERNKTAERSLALYAMICLHMDRRDEAGRASAMLQKGFPQSPALASVKRAFAKRPGQVLPTPKPKPAPRQMGKAERAALSLMAAFMEGAADYRFFFYYFTVNILAIVAALLGMLPDLIAANFGTTIVQLGFIIMAIILNAERRGRILSEFIKDLFRSGPSEAQAEREFDLNTTLNRARLAERGEQFKEAAVHYEIYLKSKSDDIDVRHRLALIYHNKTGEPVKALGHYRWLIDRLEPGTMLHNEASEAVATLSPKRPS